MKNPSLCFASKDAIASHVFCKQGRKDIPCVLQAMLSLAFFRGAHRLVWFAGAHHKAYLVQPPQHLQGCWGGEEGVPVLQALNQGSGL